MLTHYSPLRGWLPSVTLGHKQNQAQLSGLEDVVFNEEVSHDGQVASGAADDPFLTL
jgi:hypothetical protein